MWPISLTPVANKYTFIPRIGASGGKRFKSTFSLLQIIKNAVKVLTCNQYKQLSVLLFYQTLQLTKKAKLVAVII